MPCAGVGHRACIALNMLSRGPTRRLLSGVVLLTASCGPTTRECGVAITWGASLVLIGLAVTLWPLQKLKLRPSSQKKHRFGILLLGAALLALALLPLDPRLDGIELAGVAALVSLPYTATITLLVWRLGGRSTPGALTAGYAALAGPGLYMALSNTGEPFAALLLVTTEATWWVPIALYAGLLAEAGLARLKTRSTAGSKGALSPAAGASQKRCSTTT